MFFVDDAKTTTAYFRYHGAITARLHLSTDKKTRLQTKQTTFSLFFSLILSTTDRTFSIVHLLYIKGIFSMLMETRNIGKRFYVFRCCLAAANTILYPHVTFRFIHITNNNSSGRFNSYTILYKPYLFWGVKKNHKFVCWISVF